MSLTESSAAPAGRGQRFWAPGVLAVATVACLAPFITKAYCIDDPLFLWAARHIQSHPGDFFAFDVNWEGYLQPMYDNTKNPPLGCYYIALAALLVGWSEPALHAAFLLPAIGAIWGTWTIARPMCRQPLAAALATLVSPVFLVSSTNVMCDTLALCSFVWAIAIWRKGLDTSKSGWLVLSALLVAVSALTKYFAVSLIPLLAAYTLLRNRRSAWKLVVLLLPVVLLAAYQWWTLRYYGRGLLVDAADTAAYARSANQRPIWQQTLTMLCFSGGCLVPVAFCAPWLLRKRWIAFGFFVAAATGFGIFSLKPTTIKAFEDASHFHGEMSAQIGLLCALGMLVIWLPLADLRRRRDADSAFLALWLLGTAAFAGYVNWTCNGRSILPMAPVAGILLVRCIEDRFHHSRQTGSRWTWALIPALAVGWMVGWSDFQFAESARTAANRITEYSRKRNRPLWLQGHWGFQYYMEANGAKSMDFHNPRLKRSDLLAIPNPKKSTATRIPPGEFAILLQSFDVPACSWLTTLDPQAGAGFYASAYGPMPFTFGSFPPELYILFEIQDDNVFVE
jgi:4-amino-4-deoxy-L-arabinose transferase-like glycosyltransferase